VIATGLEQLVARGDSAEVQLLSQYGLRNLLSYLERVALSEARLARLEWAYLRAFEFEPAPPTLSRALAADPAFFVSSARRSPASWWVLRAPDRAAAG
jgi:hypothetical protein